MNFRDHYAAAKAAGDTESMNDLGAQAWDEAYVRACELVGPNSPDFDTLQESIYEELTA